MTLLLEGLLLITQTYHLIVMYIVLQPIITAALMRLHAFKTHQKLGQYFAES